MHHHHGHSPASALPALPAVVDLEAMTADELREFLRERDVRVTGMRKADLLAAATRISAVE